MNKRVRRPSCTLFALILLGGGRPSLGLAEQVSLTLRAKLVASRTLLIEGTTDLPDGALLEWDVEQRLNSQHGPVIKAGKYQATVALRGWKSGGIEVWIGFNTLVEGQPAELKRRFGQNGERLTGSNVVDKKILKQVEAKRILRLP